MLWMKAYYRWRITVVEFGEQKGIAFVFKVANVKKETKYTYRFVIVSTFMSGF